MNHTLGQANSPGFQVTPELTWKSGSLGQPVQVGGEGADIQITKEAVAQFDLHICMPRKLSKHEQQVGVHTEHNHSKHAKAPFLTRQTATRGCAVTAGARSAGPGTRCGGVSGVTPSRSPPPRGVSSTITSVKPRREGRRCATRGVGCGGVDQNWKGKTKQKSNTKANWLLTYRGGS